MPRSISLLILLILAGSGRAEPDVNALLKPIREKHKVPGLVAAVLRGDKIIARSASGIRKQGAPEAITVHDQMHLGSCTKAMTATMLARLVERKILSWDNTIAGVFPDLKDKIHPDYHRVTLAQLLAHRGGLPANASWWLLGADKPTPEQRRYMLRTELTKPPKAKPGTQFHYSNMGYGVATAMAEKVTGKSWEALMREQVFGPLEMKGAGFGVPGSAKTVEQPWGHLVEGGKLAPSRMDNAPVLGPAGTVHCSLSDWAKFATAHLRGARGKDGLLKAETFRKLQTPEPGADYAFGWIVDTNKKTKLQFLAHDGSNRVWYASIFLVPDRNLAVLVATNQGEEAGQKACAETVAALVKAFVGD